MTASSEPPMKAGRVEPLTTIAWLFWHVGSMAGRAADLDSHGGTRSAESGWTAPYLGDHTVFIASSKAVEAMQTGWRELDRAIQASTDERLETITPFWSYPAYPGPPCAG